MKEQNKLAIQMYILFIVVFVVFGVIIVNEKISPLKIPKVTEKITTYLNKNYKDISTNITMEEVEYKELKYQAKVSSKDNDNLYFYIYYENKNITDTYKEDYVKGKSIISYQEDTIKKNIKKKTGSIYKITILKTLDKYTDKIKNEIINSKTPERIKIYNLEAELVVGEFTSKDIYNSITVFADNMDSKKITPKNYTFIIQDPKEETNALKISNLTYEVIKNDNFKTIINDIMKKKNNELLDTYEIEYEYLN